MSRITDMRVDRKGQGHQTAQSGRGSHHLQGQGHIVAAPLQAAQPVRFSWLRPLTVWTQRASNVYQIWNNCCGKTPINHTFRHAGRRPVPYTAFVLWA